MRLRRLLLIRGQKEAAKGILVLRLESLKPMQATQMTQILNVVKVVGCKAILYHENLSIEPALKITLLKSTLLLSVTMMVS